VENGGVVDIVASLDELAGRDVDETADGPTGIDQ
jgi:hypothetical protein